MSYHPTTEEYDKLIKVFDNIKAESDVALKDNPDIAFVPTSVYQETQIDGKCLVVGRKGSGKTALIYGHERKSKDQYLVIKRLEADELPFAALFNFYFREIRAQTTEIQDKLKGPSPVSPETDLATFIDPVRLSTYAWNQALSKTAIFFAATEVLKQNLAESIDEIKALKAVVKEVRSDISADASTDPNAFLFAQLIKAYGNISDILEVVIKQFVGFWPSLITKIVNKLVAALRAPPSKATQNGLRVLTVILAKKKKRVFLSYDRFDDFYDKHYASSFDRGKDKTEDTQSRRQLLNVLLEGMILASSELKRNSDFRWLDLLITIPMDKFLELRLRERARIEKENLVYLQWSPIELLDYVNRRIRLVLGEKIPADVNPWYFLFRETIPHLLVREAKEDSFLYIVRHTLQKPREVQIYLAALFRELKKGYKTEELPKIFRSVVQRESREIIRTELKEEFLREYPGIREIFKKIEVRRSDGKEGQRSEASREDNPHITHKNAVMEFDDFCHLISGVPLSPEISEVADIALRLYHIGLIGIRKVKPLKQEGAFERTVTQNRQEISYCYFYNSDDDEPIHNDITVAFHPMFFDELGIETTDEYIVNELKWDMFKNGHNAVSGPVF